MELVPERERTPGLCLCPLCRHFLPTEWRGREGERQWTLGVHSMDLTSKPTQVCTQTCQPSASTLVLLAQLL